MRNGFHMGDRGGGRRHCVNSLVKPLEVLQ